MLQPQQQLTPQRQIVGLRPVPALGVAKRGQSPQVGSQAILAEVSDLISLLPAKQHHVCASDLLV